MKIVESSLISKSALLFVFSKVEQFHSEERYCRSRHCYLFTQICILNKLSVDSRSKKAMQISLPQKVTKAIMMSS